MSATKSATTRKTRPGCQPPSIDTKSAIVLASGELARRMEHQFNRDAAHFSGMIASAIADKFKENGWVVMPKSMLDYTERMREADPDDHPPGYEQPPGPFTQNQSKPFVSKRSKKHVQKPKSNRVSK